MTGGLGLRKTAGGRGRREGTRRQEEGKTEEKEGMEARGIMKEGKKTNAEEKETKE